MILKSWAFFYFLFLPSRNPCAKAQYDKNPKSFNVDAAELTADLNVLSNFVERHFKQTSSIRPKHDA